MLKLRWYLTDIDWFAHLLMGRSAEAVRCLERRAIHQMRHTLTGPHRLAVRA
ncbi:hypothetical protein [Micromonospora maris]|uniref:hypothetical protein n=1 Tax=Micromonospora maris TaxID=1003110 RepID=UPI002E1542CE|nr:hypothetical protein OG712_20115 [Micromonospora maris]